MLELGLEPPETYRTVYVKDEPALEIALPEVCEQPALTTLQRGRLANVEGLVGQLFRRYQANPQGPLGPDYQELVTEFQPLFTWTTACWDYLLSTEGCRFLPRHPEQRAGVRGDYRAVTDKDYSRIVHAIFRACVLEFAQQPEAEALGPWLRERLWPTILAAYRKLEQPADPRQRVLTAYSYLRCVPYRFLNDYHDELVYRTLHQLPDPEHQAIDAYFLHFYTEPAAAVHVGASVEGLLERLRHGLTALLIHHRLVYCLLRQIERY